MSASNDSVLIEAGISPVETFYSPPSPSSRLRSRTSTPRSSFNENDKRPKLSVRSNDSVGGLGSDADFQRRVLSRPRRVYSFEYEDDSPTSALREGIHEAKETVHQMGDVLDTPRMTPQRRSPIPKMNLTGPVGSPPFPTTTSLQLSKPSDRNEPYTKPIKGYDKKRKVKSQSLENNGDVEGDASTSTSSSASFDSTISQQNSVLNEEKRLPTGTTPMEVMRNFSSENSLRSVKQAATPGSPIVVESSDGASTSGSGESESPKTAKTTKKSKVPKETKVSKKKNPTPSKNETTKSNPYHLPNIFGASVTNGDSLLSAEQGEVFDPHPKDVTSPVTAPPTETIDQHLAQFETLPELSQSRAGIVETPVELIPSFSQLGALGDSKPAEIPAEGDSPETFVGEAAASSQNPFSTVNMPLLPDDRPTLIQEVAKAREEARKWFSEVTQSDRERRELGRRLEELENELARLKNVEDR